MYPSSCSGLSYGGKASDSVQDSKELNPFVLDILQNRAVWEKVTERKGFLADSNSAFSDSILAASIVMTKFFNSPTCSKHRYAHLRFSKVSPVGRVTAKMNNFTELNNSLL